MEAKLRLGSLPTVQVYQRLYQVTRIYTNNNYSPRINALQQFCMQLVGYSSSYIF